MDFLFSVRATSDVIVEFLPETKSYTYAFTLGASFNEICTISNENRVIAESNCVGIVSGAEIRSFRIQITDGSFNYYL